MGYYSELAVQITMDPDKEQGLTEDQVLAAWYMAARMYVPSAEDGFTQEHVKEMLDSMTYHGEGTLLLSDHGKWYEEFAETKALLWLCMSVEGLLDRPCGTTYWVRVGEDTEDVEVRNWGTYNNDQLVYVSRSIGIDMGASKPLPFQKQPEETDHV